MSGIPLSLSLSRREIYVANKSMRHALGEANCGPTSTCSKAVPPRSQVKYNEYTPEKRVKMGGYGGPSKVARHFSQLLDGQLLCSFYVLSVCILQGTSNICLSAGPLLVVKLP